MQKPLTKSSTSENKKREKTENRGIPARPKVQRKPKPEIKEEDMLYTWRDKKTNISIDIYRRLADIDTPPDKDEVPEDLMSIEDFAEAEWERILTPTPHIGEKGKGYW